MSSVLVEADFPAATGLWRMLSTQRPADNPSRCSSAFIHQFVHESTHQHVLDGGAAADFQSFFGVLHAELNAEVLPLSKTFIFVFFVDLLDTLCYVMLATLSSLSLTPLTYLAGQKREFLLVLAFCSCLSSEVIV